MSAMGIEPDEWFLVRLDEPPQLQARLNEHGNWDVLLRIDGGYSEEDLPRVMGYLRSELHVLIAELNRRRGRAA